MSPTGPKGPQGVVPPTRKEEMLKTLDEARTFLEENDAECVFVLSRVAGEDFTTFKVGFDPLHEIGALEVFQTRLVAEAGYLGDISES